MRNTGSLGLRPCPGSERSLASSAPIFNGCAMESRVPQHLGRCRAGRDRSASITRLSSLLRKRARAVSDVVLKPPGATGTAWPFCTAPAVGHSQTHPHSGIFWLNDTLKFHLLNCLPSCLQKKIKHKLSYPHTINFSPSSTLSTYLGI